MNTYVQWKLLYIFSLVSICVYVCKYIYISYGGDDNKKNDLHY